MPINLGLMVGLESRVEARIKVSNCSKSESPVFSHPLIGIIHRTRYKITLSLSKNLKQCECSRVNSYFVRKRFPPMSDTPQIFYPVLTHESHDPTPSPQATLNSI